ncbi:MAG TPA: hypothetical protein VF677_06280 [Flavobacterium sp.]|jgi:mono/diheme cytochrome c family protein
MDTQKFFLMLIVSFMLNSCTTQSTSDLLDIKPIEGDVTYTNRVQDIINANCIVCHGNPPGGAPNSLATYQDVKDAVLTKGLIDRINLPQGAGGAMPPSGKLPQPIIDQIIKWQADGLKE